MSNYPAPPMMPGYPPPPQVPYPPPAPPPPGPRRYGILRAIVLAPFSSDLWRDVARNWRGIGLMYMLVLLLITWIPMMIKGYQGFARFAKEVAPSFVEQVPPITITDGVVSTDVPQPHVITNPENGQPFIVIDTTGETTEPPGEAPSMLLTRSAFIMRKSPQEVRSYSLSEVGSFYMDKQKVYGWLNTLKTWFLPLLVPLMVVLSLIGRLILMLITAAIGMAMASGSNVKLPFAAMLRLAALAMTPSMLLFTVLGLLGVPDIGCFGAFVGIGIVLAYLLFMVRAAKTEFSPPQMPYPGVM